MPISTRSKYASGEASPPPHCLANASTIEEHNDYQVKFRKELQERKAQRLREAQEALGASNVEKHFEGVRRSQPGCSSPKQIHSVERVVQLRQHNGILLFY